MPSTDSSSLSPPAPSVEEIQDDEVISLNLLEEEGVEELLKSITDKAENEAKPIIKNIKTYLKTLESEHSERLHNFTRVKWPEIERIL